MSLIPLTAATQTLHLQLFQFSMSAMRTRSAAKRAAAAAATPADIPR